MRLKETGEFVYLVKVDDDEGRNRVMEPFKTREDAEEYIRDLIDERIDEYEMDDFKASYVFEDLVSNWADYADERFWVDKLYIKEKDPTVLEVMNESTK